MERSLAKSSDLGVKYIWASFRLIHALANQQWVGYLNFLAFNYIILRMGVIMMPVSLGNFIFQCLVHCKCSVVIYFALGYYWNIPNFIFPTEHKQSNTLYNISTNSPGLIHFHAPDSDRGQLSYTLYKIMYFKINNLKVLIANDYRILDLAEYWTCTYHYKCLNLL